jgi:hypothetical protein
MSHLCRYAAEFDRAHYPLPLALDVDPSCSALRRTIDRLRCELRAKCETGGADKRLAEVDAENGLLRQKLADASRQRSPSSLESHIEEMAEAYERLRKDYENLRNGSAHWKVVSCADVDRDVWSLS